MDAIEVSTVVYLPPEEVYDFLVDFPGYARYSEHLRTVRADGDGTVGTHYELTFAWWKLTYTVRTEVTDLDRPARIDWEVVRGIDARGHWRVEPADDEAPPDRDHATRIYFLARFDLYSASPERLDLPRLIDLGWVIEKVTPVIREEAERVVERVVADLEGRPRDVELQIDNSPDDD